MSNSHDHRPYNEVGFKASHNSYDRTGLTLADQLATLPADPHRGGCRGLELDLHQTRGRFEWNVSHITPLLSKNVAPLHHFLAELKAWSEANPGHDVITVTMDIKRMRGDKLSWIEPFDAYVKRHLGAGRIFKPGHFLANDQQYLTQAVHERGWPTLGELRGKFILVLSGAEKRKRAYAGFKPLRRVCFADRLITPFSKHPATGQGHRVFLNVKMTRLDEVGGDEEEDPTLEFEFSPERINAVFERVVKETRFVTRGFGLNNRSRWSRAQKLGVNIVATDEADGKSWAKVGREPFAERTFKGI